MSSDQNAAGPSAPFPDDPTVSPAKPPPYEETREKGVRDSPAVECIANEKDRNFKVRYIEQNWPQGTSRRVPIIMQDENGPCPLLAVVNCLTLQGCIRLPPSDINHGEISLATLTNVVGNHLLEQASKRENVAARETMSILNTCMEQMDKLKHGLDVEIKFDCITGVGETQMHGFFDLAGLNLYHGWVIDPEDEELVRSVGNMNHSEATAAATEDTRQGLVLRKFLQIECSQLTYCGLQAIYEVMRDGDVAVFFRNCHFSTIVKYEQFVYQLVTDVGYLNKEHIVYESLDNLDGSGDFVTANFRTPPVEKTEEERSTLVSSTNGIEPPEYSPKYNPERDSVEYARPNPRQTLPTPTASYPGSPHSSPKRPSSSSSRCLIM